MRRGWRWTGLLLVVLALAGCGRLDWSFGPLLYNVRVAPEAITPNADGDTDVTDIRYSLRRSAQVSIYFENEAGERYYFRRDQRRSPGQYGVQWGGVAELGAQVEDDGGTYELVSRVLDDGTYTWTIEATDSRGQVERASGAITLADADTEPPIMHNFAVIPQEFRPNQDGLEDDRVSISYYLTKDADAVSLYLLSQEDPDFRYYIPEAPGVVEPTERGYHEYRYEGGVDLNAMPPPDGDYIVVGETRDAAGNATRVVQPLNIREGGKPRADVAGGEIDWMGEMGRVVVLPLGGKLCFSTVVTNEGRVPIRTSGPWPGQEYRFSENSNTLAAAGHPEWGAQSGVWRFGVNFDTTGVDFPYRWAVGRQEDLERRVINGQEQWYLMPGKSGQVSGCILIDEEPPAGTNFWWGGLIHQAVGVANNDVNRISVEVGAP